MNQIVTTVLDDVQCLQILSIVDYCIQIPKN